MFVSVQFKLKFESREDKEKVLNLMRLQSSAIRFIWSRLREGKQEKEAYDLARKYFELPSWYVSSTGKGKRKAKKRVERKKTGNFDKCR